METTYILLVTYKGDPRLIVLASYPDLEGLNYEAQEQINGGVVPSDLYYLEVGKDAAILHQCAYEPVVSWEKV